MATVDPLAALYKLFASVGPTAYTPAIRHNLGLDIKQGGKPPTSGMTQFAPFPGVTGYKPRPAPTDPLVPLLAKYVPPKTPVTPPVVTPKPPVVPVTPPTGGGVGGGGSYQWVNGQLVKVGSGYAGGANSR